MGGRVCWWVVGYGAVVVVRVRACVVYLGGKEGKGVQIEAITNL